MFSDTTKKENILVSKQYAVRKHFFTRVAKSLKDNNYNSLYFAQKYACIFVLGHYLFLEAHSFPRASLSDNCSHLGIG